MAFDGAQVTKSANATAQNLTTATAMTFNTETYDTNTYHDNSTNPTRMTIPSGVDRVWLLGAVYLSSIATNEPCVLEIKKNGAAIVPRPAVTESFNSTIMLREIFTSAIDVTAGDYFEFFVSTTSDTSVTVENVATGFYIEAIPAIAPTFSGAVVCLSGNGGSTNYSTLTVVGFDTENLDVGGWHDNVTNNSRMTVISGVAYVRNFGQLYLAAEASNSGQACIFRVNAADPTAKATYNYRSYANGEGASQTWQLPIPVSVGDYVEMFVTCTDTTTNLQASDTAFGVFKAG